MPGVYSGMHLFIILVRHNQDLSFVSKKCLCIKGADRSSSERDNYPHIGEGGAQERKCSHCIPTCPFTVWEKEFGSRQEKGDKVLTTTFLT